MDATDVDSDSVVGDECHIVSRQKNGPRYREDYPDDEHDLPKNIILLCKTHHKQIDDQVETFNESLLLKIKSDHEEWVKTKLSEDDNPKPVRIRRIKNNIPSHLQRIENGKELLSLAVNTCAAYYDYEDLDTDKLVDLVAGFYQNLQDWVDIGVDEIGQRMDVERNLTNDIRQLEEFGLWVFAAREQQLIEGGVGTDKSWPVIHLYVMSKDNDSIIKIDKNAS